MNPLFNVANCRPADVLHVWTDSGFSREVCRALGSAGSHDAMFVSSNAVGESKAWPPFAGVNPLAAYEKKMRAGKVRVAVLRCGALDPILALEVVRTWNAHVRGTFYDFFALPRLWIKNRVADLWPDKAVGWEWAHWCTEGLRDAFRLALGGLVDPWHKENPTPRTTENRLREGEFADVSAECLTAEGLKYRLAIPEKA